MSSEGMANLTWAYARNSDHSPPRGDPRKSSSYQRSGSRMDENCRGVYTTAAAMGIAVAEPGVLQVAASLLLKLLLSTLQFASPQSSLSWGCT
eukprot:CAMPEP_0181370018 /NCGR_PEP_ID=MMETSP1106-20121128/13150_1 /TAXON_ID=81844 /ORGANISM="Mantoniella antarctica, Strain SL-175" /LENGTH=92 /DNA_ID=CAMNT_0023486679 /DNA_START=61 /DNA_END=340 /DNA_ORIENTATION=+